MYHPATPRERIEEDLAVGGGNFFSPERYRVHLSAMLAWDVHSRLTQINAPILLIHGHRDRLVPVENSTLIATHTSLARLVVLSDAGHVFTTDQPALTNQQILRFLSVQSD